MQYKRKLINTNNHQLIELSDDKITNTIVYANNKSRVIERFTPNAEQREKVAAICAMSGNGWVN